MGRLRFELRTNRLKAECSTAELATLAMGLDGMEGRAGLTIQVFPASQIEGITRPAPTRKAVAPWFLDLPCSRQPLAGCVLRPGS